jgi:hypothetical protein
MIATRFCKRLRAPKDGNTGLSGSQYLAEVRRLEGDKDDKDDKGADGRYPGTATLAARGTARKKAVGLSRKKHRLTITITITTGNARC